MTKTSTAKINRGDEEGGGDVEAPSPEYFCGLTQNFHGFGIIFLQLQVARFSSDISV